MLWTHAGGISQPTAGAPSSTGVGSGVGLRGFADELADGFHAGGRLIIRDERVAVRNFDQARVREVFGQPPPVVAGHDPVFGRPQDQRRAVEATQLMSRRSSRSRSSATNRAWPRPLRSAPARMGRRGRQLKLGHQLAAASGSRMLDWSLQRLLALYLPVRKGNKRLTATGVTRVTGFTTAVREDRPARPATRSVCAGRP